jgi:hypothetical protein
MPCKSASANQLNRSLNRPPSGTRKECHRWSGFVPPADRLPSTGIGEEIAKGAGLFRKFSSNMPAWETTLLRKSSIHSPSKGMGRRSPKALSEKVMPTGMLHSSVPLFPQQYQNPSDFGILKYSGEWQKKALSCQASALSKQSRPPGRKGWELKAGSEVMG